MADAPRAHLAKAITDRRKSLTLSVSKAAAAAGISRQTWTAAETGTRETESYIYGAIEQVLHWRPGSIDAILAGGEATPLGGNARNPTTTPDGAPTGQMVEQWLRTIWDDPVLTDDDKRELEDRLRRMAAAYRAGEAEKQALQERMRYLQERHTA